MHDACVKTYSANSSLMASSHLSFSCRSTDLPWSHMSRISYSTHALKWCAPTPQYVIVWHCACTFSWNTLFL